MARSMRAASSGRSANQVGKAAIIGWREVLAPALRGGGSVSLWPFDGSLPSLLVPGNVVVAAAGVFLSGSLAVLEMMNGDTATAAPRTIVLMRLNFNLYLLR